MTEPKIYMRLLRPACILLAAAALSACHDSGEDAPQLLSNIKINTKVEAGSTRSVGQLSDNSFTVLFWRDAKKLESPGTTGTAADWKAPYAASTAPQPVDFYNQIVFDTQEKYPSGSILYATGFAPGRVLAADGNEGYKKLKTGTVSGIERGRYDFLSCDVWRDVYKGSQDDPFAQEKNRLYFRHMAAKLVFYATRDKLMTNAQYVRNVQITNLQMSIDGGTTWTAMYTPSEFEWQTLDEDDYTDSYNKVIQQVQQINVNAGNAVSTKPAAGYKAIAAEAFAGVDNDDFVLKGNSGDLIPITGLEIDSCFVCNPFKDGKVQTGGQIMLKMDISAELSYSQNFPLPDATDGSDTDNLTFTIADWKGVTVSVFGINSNEEVDPDKPVREFRAGREYRIYLNFNRTGVNLVAKQVPWNYGGPHYVIITGGEENGN